MAKIHTVDWTPAILPLPATDIALNINWSGVIGEDLKQLLGGIGEGEMIVYEWSGNNWSQKGSSIVGSSCCTGETVDVSADGNTIVAGAPRENGPGDDRGVVRVYEWDGSDWDQKGGDLVGAIDEGG